MIEMIFVYATLILIGLGSGLIVGSGYVAVITVLGIIPRLTQISKTNRALRYYQWSVIFGALLGVYFSITTIGLSLPIFISIVWGFTHGIFIGMLAAALTEVLNVFPILMKRIRMRGNLLILLMAIVLGKILGSLFHWVIFVNWME
ncbi:stage V sporulation protein AB [Saliterribacillus persicus]|uniref:Stage V sporulation protein AB n=1 Tax=Saliterribacillus persicus TaxID=930114 RepID=A0A368XA67_9BACI|nr:stage V sporulation protein AB [Saliterribacillus persicus]RCW64861.1 stage V sporulation protein AB [Saliterribacillus persicus]